MSCARRWPSWCRCRDDRGRGFLELVTDGTTGWMGPCVDVVAVAGALEQALTDGPARTRIAEAVWDWVIAHEGLAESTAKLAALFAANGVRVAPQVRT